MDNTEHGGAEDSFSVRLDVREHLERQRKWIEDWRLADARLNALLGQLDPTKPVEREKGVLIASQRRKLKLRTVADPLGIPSSVAKEMGLNTIRARLVEQFARLTKDEKLLWMQNFLFIFTPDLRDLDRKIANVRSYRSFGQQRNFLLGGVSGMGKSTYLNWYTSQHMPLVEQERNRVPVIRVDAPVNNKSPKSLFQRMILECGMPYNQRDNEEDLLARLVVYIQQCGVEVIFIDEIEHLVRPEIRRRVLEVSNVSPGIPIICASCNPVQWTIGDAEIAGRWNDSFQLQQYTGDRLTAHLQFIEILLPFTRDSHLADRGVSTKSTGGEPAMRCADLIEAWTGGVLRDIMVLVSDSCRRAIDRNEPCLSPTLLAESWQDIQTNRVTDFTPSK